MRAIQNADLRAQIGEFRRDLAKAHHHQRVAGVRHIIDDPLVLLHHNARNNLQYLQRHGFIFELQIALADTRLFSALMHALEYVPELSISLNHYGWIPEERTNRWRQWKAHFKQFIQLPNTVVKASGLEMIRTTLMPEQHLFALDACLNELSVKRLLAASNFPLITLHQSYHAYWLTILQCAERLGVDSNLLMRQNAQRFYRVDCH